MIRAIQTLSRSHIRVSSHHYLIRACKMPQRTEGSLREVVGPWEGCGLRRNRLGSNHNLTEPPFPTLEAG